MQNRMPRLLITAACLTFLVGCAANPAVMPLSRVVPFSISAFRPAMCTMAITPMHSSSSVP